MQKYDVNTVDENKIMQDIKSHYRNYMQTGQLQKNPLDKVYICMGTDDLRSGHTKALHDLYTNNNIPYYMASIPDAIKNCVANAPYYTNLDYMRMCVQNGGEIICHNGTPITNDDVDDFNKLYHYFYLNKKELEYYGFKVRGIFKAGGTRVINGRDERIDPWAIYLYDFGDNFGHPFPYSMNRRILEYMNGDEDMDNEIDNAFANKDYLSFATHELTEDSQARFDHMMSRLSEYRRGIDYEFVTPSQVYDKLVSNQQKVYYTKSEVDNLISNIDGGGQSSGDNSGLSNTAKNLLLTILKATVTNSDQASNIAALETELNSGGSDTPTIINYTITNITSTVYNNGTISISAVTGNIVITASATINESEETEIELTAINQYILQNGTCNVSYSDGTEDAQFTNFKYVTSVEPFTEDTEVTATITHASTDQYLRYQKPNHFGSTPTAPTTTRADTRVVTDCIINDDMLDVVTVTWTVKAGNYLIMFYPQYLNAWDCTITAIRR